jgi:hypothetical protein
VTIENTSCFERFCKAVEERGLCGRLSIRASNSMMCVVQLDQADSSSMNEIVVALNIGLRTEESNLTAKASSISTEILG